MKVSVRYLDCCLPDYFQGTSKPHLSVPVCTESTIDNLVDYADVSDLWDDERIPESVSDDAIKAALRAEIESIGIKHLTRYLDEDSDSNDVSVYAYFAVECDEDG